MAFDTDVSKVDESQENQTIVGLSDSGMEVPGFERWMAEVPIPQPLC